MDNKKVLVVEDEFIVSLEIQDRLQSMGYSVIGTASKAEEAIKIATDIKPDLILMDIKLQGEVDGIDAARAIKSNYNVPIIFLTAFAENITLERIKKIPPYYGYIIKPFEEEELQQSIEEIFGEASNEADS